MSQEPRSGPHGNFGTLQSCLVEGDPEQRARERRIRRRSLIISISLQSVILAALVLVPLFGRPEHIAFANMIPIPPYYHNSGPARHDTAPTPPKHPPKSFFCPTCPTVRIPTNVPTEATPPQDPFVGIPLGNGNDPSHSSWNIAIDDGRRQPAQPTEPRAQTTKRISKGHLEPAMLIYRVEPAYPKLPLQMHREGHVELRAIIATDGTIQSLQVASGDVLFYQSALDAVRQWRYRPTILNGEPVEIDTYVSVIYTLQR